MSLNKKKEGNLKEQKGLGKALGMGLKDKWKCVVSVGIDNSKVGGV